MKIALSVILALILVVGMVAVSGLAGDNKDNLAVGNGHMVSAGSLSVTMAQEMENAAGPLLSSSDPALVELGQQWLADAQMLRRHGDLLSASISAGSMLHNPGHAHELNPQDLQANGLVMVAEGQTLADHGRGMVTQVADLQRDGILPSTVTEELLREAEMVIAVGENLVNDGEYMQDYADGLLRSLGQ